VRNFKREVLKCLKEGNDLESITIPAINCGRPLLLPEEIDELTKKFIQNLRFCGSPALC
jgi:hypothetical protein